MLSVSICGCGCCSCFGDRSEGPAAQGRILDGCVCVYPIVVLDAVDVSGIRVRVPRHGDGYKEGCVVYPSVVVDVVDAVDARHGGGYTEGCFV